MGRKKNKHRKTYLLARSKLNTMQQMISKALLDSYVSHDEFTLVINEEQTYRWLKEIIRVKKSHREIKETDK